MATYSRKLNLSRDQLSQFLTDQQQIRQFEQLFSVVDSIAPDVVNEIKAEAGSAQAAANEALSQIISLANSIDLFSTAPATQNNNSIKTDYLDFNGFSPESSQIRRMAWNEADQTLNLGMEYGVVQQIGLETYARVQNNTGVTIPNGTVVGFTGAVPDSALSISPYLADGSTPSLYILGVMTHDLPDTGQKGYCTVWGFVRDVNTSAFSLGDVLYASPTVAGGFTNVKPTAPNNVIPIAAVLQVGVTDGIIFVRPTIEQQKYYGEFTKTSNQSPAAINTAYALTFDNTQIANGISIGSPVSRIYIQQSGLYNVSCSVQAASTSSSQKSIWLWIRLNGTTDITNSARIASNALNNGYLIISINELLSFSANDFIEIMYASDSTNVTISTVAATAFAPDAPAAILSITQTEQ